MKTVHARVLCHVLREKAPVRAWREGGARARTHPSAPSEFDALVTL